MEMSAVNEEMMSEYFVNVAVTALMSDMIRTI